MQHLIFQRQLPVLGIGRRVHWIAEIWMVGSRRTNIDKRASPKTLQKHYSRPKTPKAFHHLEGFKCLRINMVRRGGL